MSEQSLKNKAVKGIAWKSINTFGKLGVSFIVSIILARKLMPADYGAIAMIAVFTSVLDIFTDGGLTAAIVRKENRTETDKCTLFYYNLVASYIIYFIIFTAAPFIANFYQMPILCKLTRVMSLGLLINPFASIQSIHFTINIDFKTPAYISLSCTVISAIIAIWMAYNGYGVWALTVPTLFTSVIGTIVKIIIVRWYPRSRFSWDSFKELFGFSSKLLGVEIINRIYNNITPLIVGKFFSPAQLGLYEKAKGWPSLPSETFTGVLQGVTFPVLSKMQDDTERLAANYRRIIKLSAFIVFPIVIGLAAVAKPMTIVLVTEKWIDSVLLMQLICFSMMWYPIHAINLNLLLVTGHSEYSLKLEIIKKIWGLIVLCAALPFGLIVFCAAGTVSSYVSLFINTWYTKKIINFGFWEQLRDLLPILGNCLIMGIICLAVQYPFDNHFIKLLLGIPIAIIYYIISARYLNREQFNEIIDIIALKLPKLSKYHI